MNVTGLNQRGVRQVLGMLYKALILGTLSAMFVFAPLRQQLRSEATAKTVMAPIQELPESDGDRKVLWLTPRWAAMGQGDSLSRALEE